MDGAFIALKGYKFQFDKTILEIFSNPTKKIYIEQLQDYGLDNYLVQVKYHNTDYSATQQKQMIRKPLLQLIHQFKENKTMNFILYIYLKGILPQKITLKISDLDKLIGKSRMTKQMKVAFLNQFTLVYAEDFQTQYYNVIEKIKSEYTKSNEEAEIYYAIISSHLLDIVIKNPPLNKSNRVISKIEMDNLIKSGKKLIFKSTFIEIQKTEQHFKYLNRIFFNPSLNKEPYERVFIIEIEKPIEKKNLKEIIFILKNKWSKNNSKAIPDNDRFAPYIFFNGIDDYSLAQLKSDLQKENYIIKDGYEFLNASFNLQSLKERPTFLNRIFFKFINNQSDLELFLERIDRTTEIYQFFINNPISINYSGKHTKMEIKNIEEIKGII